MLMDYINTFFPFQNPEIQINIQNNKSILEMNPNYSPMGPINKQMKKLLEKEFLSNYNRIYKMKN
jgi:hypothetical protein